MQCLYTNVHETMHNIITYHCSVSCSTSNTWSIKMLGQDEEDIKVMESVFPNDVQLNVGVQGSDRIFWSVGPKSFRPFIQPHLSPLSQLLKNNEDLAVDLAFVTDARKFASGFIDIAISAGSITAEDAIPSAPSADASFILGRNSSGWAATYEIDLLGFAKLVNDLDDLN